MPEYVRLTFQAVGGRKRTVWAEIGKTDGPVRTFWRTDKYGERPYPPELIMIKADEPHTVEPARMNNHYAMLELKK